jgi:hypothetical protein
MVKRNTKSHGGDNLRMEVVALVVIEHRAFHKVRIYFIHFCRKLSPFGLDQLPDDVWL